MPTLSLPVDYASTFGQKLSIPVIEDDKLRLSDTLRKSFAPDTSFEVSLDEAIATADRHLHVYGKPPGTETVRLVGEWLDILRWELATFWSCNPNEHWYDDDKGRMAFSQEHPRRVGELLAEGLAIRLLEKRLLIPRSKLFFYSGTDARPDFVMRPLPRMSRAVLNNDRRLFALECRSRKGWSSIRSSDYEQLRKKKKRNFSAAIAIYSCYGPPSENKKLPRTRYLLGDPPGQAGPASRSTVLRALLVHYIGVTSRLGLWSHHQELQHALKALDDGAELQTRADPGMRGDAHLNRVQRGSSEYLGRFFSEFVLRYQRRQFTRASVRRRIQDGDLGSIVYHGLSADVLRAIRSYDWDTLEAYFDENTVYDGDIGGDGTLKTELKEGSDDYAIAAKAIHAELG